MPKRTGANDASPTQFLHLSELLEYVGMVLERGIPGSVWVQAEVASVTDRRHLYLDLVQHDQNGREIAKTRANVWARERFQLEGKFRRGTGGALAADMKVLLQVIPDFHPQYGFSLTVIDVAPEFTVGDMHQKLARMREALVAEGLYDRNRALALPRDFTRVAVLSPAGAAGLGDFRREADRLQRARLCDFAYFEATFQGREASASLQGALREAARAHDASPFDALAVIRGGGASTDLAWLNDLEVARLVCTFPAPVVTGIGHAQDDTLLDEVAAHRCDTPSKVAGLFVNRIRDAAQEAREHTAFIRSAGRGALLAATSDVEALRSRARRAARDTVERRAADVDHLMRQVLGLTPERTLRRGYALVRSGGGVVTSAAQARGAGRLSLQFHDGSVDAAVIDASAVSVGEEA